MNPKVKKVLSVILNVVLWVVILLAALFAFTTLATKDPYSVSRVMGYTPMSVQTDSMKPTFCAGDMIIIKKCDPDQLEVGDIITFHAIIENQNVLNTHRIEKIDDSTGVRVFTTKGDNNALSDKSEIVYGDIVGEYVTKIPGLGKVMDFLKSSVGFLVCILLPMLAFFIYQVYNLIVIASKYKKAVALEEAEEAAKLQPQNNANEEADRLRAELEEAKRKLAESENQTSKVEEPEVEIKESYTYDQVTSAYSKLMDLYNVPNKTAEQVNEYNKQLADYQHMLEVYQKSQK